MLRLYAWTAIQKDCGPNFKLLSKKTAGQEGWFSLKILIPNIPGFRLRIRHKTEKFCAFFFCSGTEQELRDMSAFLLRIYFVVCGF